VTSLRQKWDWEQELIEDHLERLDAFLQHHPSPEYEIEVSMV